MARPYSQFKIQSVVCLALYTIAFVGELLTRFSFKVHIGFVCVYVFRPQYVSHEHLLPGQASGSKFYLDFWW